MPLIITHGWPGSIVEFHKVIEPLVDPVAHGGDPADAFHVVCPSLPGFGFSAKPKTTGWGIDRIAAAWAKLMARLGYARYGAQGGDWGSAVTTSLGAQDAEHCAGIHITLAMSTRPRRSRASRRRKRAGAHGDQALRRLDSGYSKQQSTRPQTLGYGLTDSPAGQAAWILEKFWAWTDCDGHPENILDRDELLDNVMLYWATADGGVVGPALLGELRQAPHDATRSTVPTGVAVFPQGDRHAGTALDGAELHRHPPLERDGEGRALRRLRAARAVRRRRQEVLCDGALSHADRGQDLRRAHSQLPLGHPGALQYGGRLLRSPRRRHRPPRAGLCRRERRHHAHLLRRRRRGVTPLRGKGAAMAAWVSAS